MWAQYSALGRRFMFCGSNWVSTDWEKASCGSLLVFTPDLDVFGGYVLNPQMGCSVSVWHPSRTEFGTSCRFQFWRGCRKCLKSSCYKVIHQNPRHSFTHIKDFFFSFLSLSSLICDHLIFREPDTPWCCFFVLFFKFKPPFFFFADVFSQYVSFQFLEIISVISPASSTFQQMFSNSFALCDVNLAAFVSASCHTYKRLHREPKCTIFFPGGYKQRANFAVLFLLCIFLSDFWMIGGLTS